MKRTILIILFIFSTVLWAETPTIETIKTNIVDQFAQIEDYQVNIKISVKMTGFRMPRKKIRMYYKSPDKVKVETKGFAILPKTGADGNPNKFLDMLTQVTSIESVKRDGKDFYKIIGNVNRDSLKIPVDDRESDIPEITMKVFVDAEHWIITEVGVALDDENVFTFHTEYMDVKGIMVPKESVFKIGMKGISRWSTQNPFDFGGPGSDRQDFDNIAKDAGFDPKKDEFVGELKMKFSKYKINEGIDDSIFEE
ncbi:MAG: hypothetical protein QF418_01420 [Candidatus Marinimicrobia bacterium]|jgi:hypothetical protein|nr:hypothetical protein [Candidatus Neomarinimicrobiota bacterium]MDP6755380.1 hypothetical protein [Candidatus Neomarinimicrobiota bacterium]